MQRAGMALPSWTGARAAIGGVAAVTNGDTPQCPCVVSLAQIPATLCPAAIGTVALVGRLFTLPQRNLGKALLEAMRTLPDPASRYVLTRFLLKLAFFVCLASAHWLWEFGRTLVNLLFLAALLDVGIAVVRKTPFHAPTLTYWDEAIATLFPSLLVLWKLA
ncbi:hypothetical protein NKJ90_14360 [Mesorhizobium sp. M0051]|uniref:hypothetical protein n=1 Tax=Mesorhizobium sp. M0051 TaxID=2956862 RepID=UPI0033367E20